jgi:hypothetical protein
LGRVVGGRFCRRRNGIHYRRYAWSLVSAGTLNPGTGLYSLLALVPALAGMIAG